MKVFTIISLLAAALLIFVAVPIVGAQANNSEIYYSQNKVSPFNTALDQKRIHENNVWQGMPDAHGSIHNYLSPKATNYIYLYMYNYTQQNDTPNQ
jgi:hypothetical protein